MADRLTGLGGGEKASSRILPTKCKEALFSQRGHPEGGSSWGNGDRESHATKLRLSCLRDMWVVLESSPGWGRDWGLLTMWRDGLGRGSQKGEGGQDWGDSSTAGMSLGCQPGRLMGAAGE